MAAIRGVYGARVVYTAAVVVCGTVGAGCRHRVVPEPYRDRTIWFIPAAGCAASPDTNPRWLPPTRASDTLSLAYATRDPIPPRVHAWLARRVPGGYGGGPYAPGDGGPSFLFLRDTSRLRGALGALDSLRPPRDPSFFEPRHDSVVATPVRWDFAEYYDWLTYLESNFEHPRQSGIEGWGIDQFRQRLIFALDSASRIPAFLQWLQRLNVPCYLVKFEVSGPLHLGGAIGRAPMPRSP